jgi:hypothetical protein
MEESPSWEADTLLADQEMSCLPFIGPKVSLPFPPPDSVLWQLISVCILTHRVYNMLPSMFIFPKWSILIRFSRNFLISPLFCWGGGGEISVHFHYIVLLCCKWQGSFLSLLCSITLGGEKYLLTNAITCL